MKEIAKKMALVTREIQQPMKSKNIKHLNNHAYSTKDDIFLVVRDAMTSHNMAIVPSVELIDTITETKGSYIIRVRLTVVVIDGDSGESMTSHWDGEATSTDRNFFGIPGATTQAVRSWAANTFLLMDGDYHEEFTGTTAAKKEVTTIHEAPPADPLKAIETRVRRLKFSDDQLDQYLDFIAGKENADVITDVSESRLLYWHSRMETNDDTVMTAGINKIIQGVSA